MPKQTNKFCDPSTVQTELINRKIRKTYVRSSPGKSKSNLKYQEQLLLSLIAVIGA